MDIIEKYLSTVDRHLKPLPISERADIVREIKGTAAEMENDGMSREQILERLGDPKELAKAYLGNLLTERRKFSVNGLLTAMAFYSVVGFSGLIVIPVLGIVAPVFMLCGVVTPILGGVKLLNLVLNLNIPFIDNIVVFQIGSFVLSPVPAFIASVAVGAALYFAGRASWRGLVLYCKKVSGTKRKLSV